jgi:enoyl-CoA hydratase/carnithine racemase
MNDPGVVRCRIEGAVAHIIFDRPVARNAMTWTMYEQLGEACEQVASAAEVRVAVFRGAGGKAFVAGTDIAQFLEFKSAQDGVDYERRVEPFFAMVENLPVPTLAVVEGWAVGGGLAIAAACDLRIATPGTRFGMPIARTIGNCLSLVNYARLVAGLGEARTKKMLMLAEMLSAEEAAQAGFVAELVTQAELGERIDALCGQLVANAPLTLRITKQALQRLRHNALPDDEDLIRQCYGSEDFHTGVAAFVAKQTPRWSGR